MAGMSTEGWLPALGMEVGSVGSGMEEEGLRRRLESVRKEAGVLREEEADASGRRRPAPRAGGSLGENDSRDAETTAAAQGRRRGGGGGEDAGGEEEEAGRRSRRRRLGVTAARGMKVGT